MEMHKPPHPGRIIRLHMNNQITVEALAKHLKMTRANLSMILNGRLGISAAVAIKLGDAFPNANARLWMDLQTHYDLARARRKKRVKIKPLFKQTKVSTLSEKSNLKKAA